ncbi:MAG: hypothetical protein ASARMPREDX12_001020 [Alectoria sarmentosa]|nr:MAG: hypothetical protein ASARMPREDX12_001020 [Alectoria sarmentosa]
MQVGLRQTPPPAYERNWYLGQSSRNKLIVFADGTYLELFCWINTPREFYAWADKSPGLIDFTLTSMPPSTAQSLHHSIMPRLRENQNGKELDLGYTLPDVGSRTRWDAVQVKWESSRPVSSNSLNLTDFPFLCHDVTPRTVRVPFDHNERTTHPCGAVGISIVEVMVPKSRFDTFAELYGSILGASPRITDGRGKDRILDFEIGLPNQGLGPSNLSLRSEQDEIDQGWLRDRGAGIRGLVLSIMGREGHGEEALGVGGIASTISLNW